MNAKLSMMNEKENSQFITHNSPLKKGYKQTEVGVIPEDWEIKSLEELCVPSGLVRGPFGGALKKSFPTSKREQTRIGIILSSMDTEIEKLEIQLSKYKMLKTGMMQELLTGKKRLI